MDYYYSHFTDNFWDKKDVKKSPKITKHPVDGDQIRIQDVWFLYP